MPVYFIGVYLALSHSQPLKGIKPMYVMCARFTRRIAMLTASTVLVAGAALVTPSIASADTADTVTTSEVSSALSNVSGDLVVDPIPSITDTDSAAVVTQDGTTTDVPRDPEDGVTIDSKNAPAVTINLPNADDAKSAQRTSDGSVVYPGTDGSAQAVIPTDGGVQMLTTISNADAPTRYDYKVDVPDGGKVEVAEDGSAAVLGADGSAVLAVPTPWAKDANSKSVPTHFETDGTTLTQVVDHTSGDYAYPVVADPIVVWLLIAAVKCLGGAGWAWIDTRGMKGWYRVVRSIWGCLVV